MHDVLLISGMFIVTYSIRYLPFAYAHKLDFPIWLQQALSYVPVAALTAIIAPLILFHGGKEMDLSLNNAHLLAAIIAVVVSLMSKNMFLTVSSGLLFFAFFKFI